MPPGVDLPPPPGRRRARELLGLPIDGPVIGFAGRLTGVKRPDRFIEMAGQITRRHPTTTFAVAGDGELRDAMREQARLLGVRVQFLGWRGDVENFYAACDFLALTSDNEGMPVALIEAASIGTPAVTTRVGSAGEVVEDGVTGFVTDVDSSALAAAAIRLLDDDALRSSMGHAAEDRAKREFGAERLVRDISELYETIIGDRSRLVRVTAS